jgi:hypothetical protein
MDGRDDVQDGPHGRLLGRRSDNSVRRIRNGAVLPSGHQRAGTDAEPVPEARATLSVDEVQRIETSEVPWAALWSSYCV